MIMAICILHTIMNKGKRVPVVARYGFSATSAEANNQQIQIYAISNTPQLLF